MRLITWNCRVGGFRIKAKHIAPLRPDILAVQEVEPLDHELFFDGECQPTYRDRTADPAYPKRGIGVFSYTGVEMTPVDTADPAYCFRRYEARQKDLAFQVVAVWPAKTDDRTTSYKQAHEGLRRHADWVRQRPTVIMGDFNDNASYEGGKSWQRLLDLIRPLELESVYHHHFSESFGAETRPTYFHQGKETKFHLDYCFVPRAWLEHIRQVEVGTYEKWHDASDHAPLIVDLDL